MHMHQARQAERLYILSLSSPSNIYFRAIYIKVLKTKAAKNTISSRRGLMNNQQKLLSKAHTLLLSIRIYSASSERVCVRFIDCRAPNRITREICCSRVQEQYQKFAPEQLIKTKPYSLPQY